MHDVYEVINFVQALELVSHVLIDRKLAQENLVNELRHILARLPSSKSCTFPDAPCDELEWACRELLSRCSHSNDG